MQSLPLPDGALIKHFREIGGYTDCFALDVETVVRHSDFVRAFYTSSLFKIERFILKWVVAKPSTDSEAEALALGITDKFAAWTVEGRTNDQLLMCDYQKRTRSWLMIAPLDDGKGTRLYFGTAVAPLRPNGRNDWAFGLGFRLLVSFHKLYARRLLIAAAAQV